MKKKFFASIFLLIATFSLPSSLLAEDPFELNKKWDTLLLASGLASYGSILGIKHFVSSPEYDATKVYDKNDVNALDRFFMQPYDSTLHNFGTLTCGLAMAFPAATYVAQGIGGDFSKEDIFEVAVMYAETLLFANAFKDWLKFSVKRNRPYMYFDQVDTAALDDGDFAYSWPSGHTANAFAGATFVTYTYWNYFPDSAWKIPVTLTSYAFAAGTGALRMASGNHFLTDVLSGALLGTACGFFIPFAHKHFPKAGERKGMQVTVFPYGINLHLSLAERRR